MYLSAERVAVVNSTIRDVFAQTCVAWQSIPRWDTGDPGQTEVANDDPADLAVDIQAPAQPVTVNLSDLIAPTPDALLAKLTTGVVKLAKDVDDYVFPALRQVAAKVEYIATAVPAPDILKGLINARTALENAGFRSPACLFGDDVAIKALYQLAGPGYVSVKDPLLDAGNINAVHRITKVFTPAPPPRVSAAGKVERAIVLGRRQRIAAGYAGDASPGEEPVDLAVSVGPSFEIVGETGTNQLLIKVRIRYAVRPKNPDGLVVITSP